MGVCVVSSIVISQAKTHSGSTEPRDAALESVQPFGKENKDALDHHAAPTLPARPILSKCQVFGR
jgi:hypothetical protein